MCVVYRNPVLHRRRFIHSLPPLTSTRCTRWCASRRRRISTNNRHAGLPKAIDLVHTTRQRRMQNIGTLFKEKHDQTPHGSGSDRIAPLAQCQGKILVQYMRFVMSLPQPHQNATRQVQDNLVVDGRIATPNEIPSHGASHERVMWVLRMPR